MGAPRLSGLTRMLMRVDAVSSPNGCWLWIGRTTEDGYGLCDIGGKTLGLSTMAHRAVYESMVGPIPPGLHLDHLCRVRNCVNPRHLEPVTPRENSLRATSLITHCPHGHEYTPENTYWQPRRDRHPSRVCRICQRAAVAAYTARKRERART